ncbi:MAG: putative DNA-binding domain-containing protein [Halobacteriovoraceae bacterium]|nr:putative DNA-binding domain-containing protein [Halobacteriovoraceae bacterium]
MRAPKELENMQALFIKRVVKNIEDENLLHAIKIGHRLTPSKALGVYRDDYTARLTSALCDIYKSVWRVLGDEVFFQLAQDFLASFSSQTYDLGRYGKEFSLFLSDHSISKEFPFLPELAHFERNFLTIFHAKADLGLSSENFQTLENPFEIKFQLVETHYLYESQFKIYQIFDLRNIEDKQIQPFDFHGPEFGLLYKNKEGIRVKQLCASQYRLLESILSLGTLSNALDDLINRNIEITEKEITEFMQFIVSNQLFKISKIKN